MESLCQADLHGKVFILKGGEYTLAISKQRKDELINQYVDWLDRSQALIVTEYSGLTMKQLDELRAKVREVGGEFHIVKNTLGKLAFKQFGLSEPDQWLENSTAVAFAFQDAPMIARVLSEYSRTSEFVKIKGGYLAKSSMSADQVKALAELPPLPVMRAQLLGVLLAPAGKLVRTIAEPVRQVASVLKAYAEQEVSPASA